ncbi:MAG: helix-turn-helix domain-containing protein [Desulfopila sp.]
MKKAIDEIFAERLSQRLAAEPHGYQRELAREVGVTPSYLNNLVHGRRRSTEDLRREICRAIGEEYETFVFGRPLPRSMHGPKMREFITLLDKYGPPGFLDQCIERLQEIKKVMDR